MHQKLEVHVYMYKWEWEDKASLTAISGDKMENTENRVWVKSMLLLVDIADDFDIRPAQIAALQKKKESIMADSQKELMKVEKRIQDLLAIGYTPPAIKSPEPSDDIPF